MLNNIACLANTLDEAGFESEAAAMTDILARVAQRIHPQRSAGYDLDILGEDNPGLQAAPDLPTEDEMPYPMMDDDIDGGYMDEEWPDDIDEEIGAAPPPHDPDNYINKALKGLA